MRNLDECGAVVKVPPRARWGPVQARYHEGELCGLQKTWIFPDPDGAMRTVPRDPEAILRRALKRAGIVIGHTHVYLRTTTPT
jgi:hypothetical protein